MKLFDQNNGKRYNDFLKWILENQHLKGDEKRSIKKIAEQSGYPSAKISKWLREIYDGIFELNEEQPQLFYLAGNIKVEFYLKYFDSHCSFITSLPAVPRMHESIDFFFVKAKMGISSFWVNDVSHFITENETSVVVNLTGGMVNVYRELQKYDAKMIMTIHDEIILEVKDEQLDIVVNIVKKSMEQE